MLDVEVEKYVPKWCSDGQREAWCFGFELFRGWYAWFVDSEPLMVTLAKAESDDEVMAVARAAVRNPQLSWDIRGSAWATLAAGGYRLGDDLDKPPTEEAYPELIKAVKDALEPVRRNLATIAGVSGLESYLPPPDRYRLAQATGYQDQYSAMQKLLDAIFGTLIVEEDASS